MLCIAFTLAALFMSGAAITGTNPAPGDSLNNEHEAMGPGSTNRRPYAEWDANGDGRIDEDEFYAGYEASGLFDKWDINDDGVVDSRELGEGMYVTWDFDDQTHIDDAGAPTYWFRE